MKNILKKILLFFIPAVFKTLFSIKKKSSVKKYFGLLSEEFFAESFLKNKICDIGGFGMTSKVISQYFGQKQNKRFEVTALFNRTLRGQKNWRSHIDGSLVLTKPDLESNYVKGFLQYSFYAHQRCQFLLSIDLYPGYEFSLKTMPQVPLLIWLRDPKGETELKKIATVDCEIRANKMTGWDEFKKFAQKEKDFFAQIYAQSLISHRPIIFVTNAHCLVPRAQGLYGIRGLTHYFLPNPIHYPSLEVIKKSGRPTVCMLGRIDPVKRPWICFELAKRFKDVDFLICGNTSYPEIMNPIIDKYRSVDNLKFLGLVTGDNKVDILCRSWALINTSIHEGLPCSFLESLSCHTPILSSVDPDEIVSQFGIHTGDNGGEGLEQKTLDQFQKGLEKMLADPKALQETGARGRRYIEKIYSFKSFEENLSNILSKGYRNNFER